MTVSGTLTGNGTQVQLTAPSGQNLETQNYTLVTAASFVGTVSPAVIWNVPPANANHYYVTNINNNLVLAYSAIAIPTPGGTTIPANILRNQTALLVVTAVPASGQTVTNLTVNTSSIGGSSSLALSPNGVANTWTNSIYIGPGLAPGAYPLCRPSAIDSTPTIGNGVVAVNVVASTETWAGAGANGNFDTAANWAIESGETASFAPGFTNDSLVFAGNTGLAPVMDNPYTVKGLLFASGAGSFNVTASGGNVLTLAGAGITNLSTSTETLALPVSNSVSTPEIVNAANGNLVVSGGFADNNGGLRVMGPAVSNSFTLSGASTFTGPLTVRQGSMTLAGTTVENTNGISVADIGGSVASLNVAAGGTLSVSDGLNLLVSPQANSSGVLSVTGGLLTIPAGTLNLGGGNGSSSYFNMTGGNVSVGGFVYAANYGDRARFDMSGGTFTIQTNCLLLAYNYGQSNQIAEANFSGNAVFNSLNNETTAGREAACFCGSIRPGGSQCLG